MCHQESTNKKVCHSHKITSISAVRGSYYIETHGTTWYGTDNWGESWYGVERVQTETNKDKMGQLMTKVRLGR